MPLMIAPSMLSANFANLHPDIQMINDSSADWFHIDVMDGLFVPNISFGFPVIQAIKKYAQKPLDVHLMIHDPSRYVQQFCDAGADMLTVHYEACPHLHRCVQQIKSAGMQAGVSLNPHTPVQLLSDILPDLDMVLIMSVNPGFGGQKFITNTYRKLEQLSQMRAQLNPAMLIEVDGGVDISNAAFLAAKGANVLVAGSAVFGADNPPLMIEMLKNAESK